MKDRKLNSRESKRTRRKEKRIDNSGWLNKKSSDLSAPQKKENAESRKKDCDWKRLRDNKNLRPSKAPESRQSSISFSQLVKMALVL